MSAKARSRSAVTSSSHRGVERVPKEGGDVELRLAEHPLGVDDEMTVERRWAVFGSEDVVVVEVAVDENIAADVERGVELARERDEVASLLLGALGLVEPPGHVVADPPERLSGGPPQPSSDADRDRRRLAFRQLGDVGPGPRPLEEERAPGPVVAQQPDSAVPAPERERVGLLVALRRRPASP